MRSRLAQVSVLVVGVSVMSASILAHHGDAGRYEEHLTTVKGTVVALQLTNPHSQLVFEARDEKTGQAVRWVGEWGTPRGLMQQGVTRETFKVGDTVVVTARRLKNGDPFMTLSECAQVVDLTSGTMWRGNNPVVPPGFTGDPCDGSIPIR